MEKISGILPSNSRIKSVDMKGAHPQRPGTPDFGQKMGSTSQDRISLSEQATEKAFQETLAAYNPREARHAKIAEDMSKSFFQSRMKPELRGTEDTSTVKAPAVARAARPDVDLDIVRSKPAMSESAGPVDDEPASSLDVYA